MSVEFSLTQSRGPVDPTFLPNSHELIGQVGYQTRGSDVTIRVVDRLDAIAELPEIYSRAWYGASISEFLRAESDTIVGRLTLAGSHDLQQTQRDAWIQQISILKDALKGLDGTILFEFTIPRLGRRIDTVLLVGTAVIVLEFKVGQKDFDRAAIEQVWDYALDLKNFHEASHAASIVPILVATAAASCSAAALQADNDQVYRPVCATANELRRIIGLVLQSIPGVVLDVPAWLQAPYRPTPTIVEAARALYAQHSVEAIARYDAGAYNLRVTSNRIESLVDEARQLGQKKICFVTGVPGAGKTLVGLNVATRRGVDKSSTHAVFLSGNGPLVAVLREALTRDECERLKQKGVRERKGVVRKRVDAFIQNVHHFRDYALEDPRPPDDHVVIFDEAQRAWNLRQTAAFMLRKKKRPDFGRSEPEFLISTMNRHPDWAVVVCLVGGGQEINIGEAGIGEWLRATVRSFEYWHLHISSRLTDSEYESGEALSLIQGLPNIYFEDHLHLSVSMRSFRAENVSSFVKALLDQDKAAARMAYQSLASRYPIYVTRNLDHAKRWIRTMARGSERYGLVASSKAQRLKPHAIDVRVPVNPVHYFLSHRYDTRSSYYLEDAATEFQVQGLELDWVCVTWDGDLRPRRSGWSHHDFRGDRWTKVKVEENQRYLLNAYRVLLTRARQGMVIFVPEGDPADCSRDASFYDPTFQFLQECGVRVLQ